MGDMPVLSQFTPVWGNEQFTSGKRDGRFRSWNIKGIGKMVDRVLISFDQLCQTYQILKKHFFKYLQLKNYMLLKHEQIMCTPPLSKLEEITLVNSEGKDHVSKYYSILVAHSTELTLDK